jgi:hypothetical protein
MAIVIATAGVLLASGSFAAGAKHAAIGAAGKAIPKFAMLSGRAELDAAGRRGAGDPDGRGSATVIVHRGRALCFGIAVTGIGVPIAASIHSGRRSTTGPVVLALAAPRSGHPGAASGCVAGGPRLLADVAAHPRRYYVDVATRAYPAGALRGQLFAGARP